VNQALVVLGKPSAHNIAATFNTHATYDLYRLKELVANILSPSIRGPGQPIWGLALGIIVGDAKTTTAGRASYYVMQALLFQVCEELVIAFWRTEDYSL
jgi:hypothetical protein